MLYVIDEKTGNVFDPQGSNYVNYIEGVQSTGLLYIKKIFVLTTNQELRCEIKDENSIFTFLDVDISSTRSVDNHEKCEINEFSYTNLDSTVGGMPLKTRNYVSHGYQAKCELEGVFIHCLYVFGQSYTPGTIIEEITVSTISKKNPKPVGTLLVGGDFYEENELLKSNLENLGIEIPAAFTKAIYQTNVHDEIYDNVVLNRKRKELLNEYGCLEFQKGNYNSLLNYLEWFEYGENIKLSEYWKVLNSCKDQLFERNINQLMTNEIYNDLDAMAKQTLIGIHLALSKIRIDENGEVVYETDYDDKYTLWDTYNPLLPAKTDADYDRDIKNSLFKEESDRFDEEKRAQLRDKDYEQHFEKYDLPITNNPETGQWDESRTLGRGANWWNAYPTGKVMFIAEQNPLMYRVSYMWAAEDLSLKMRLLANFYATYCMPIHLDLIQCSIEDIVFTNNIKYLSFLRKSDTRNYDTTKLHIEINPTQKDYWLNSSKENNHHSNYGEYEYSFVPYSCTYYDGIGTIATIKTNLAEVAEKNGISFKRASIILNDDGKNFYYDKYGESVYWFSSKEDYYHTFDVLVTTPGLKQVQILFETFAGDMIVSSCEFKVWDNLVKDIEVVSLYAYVNGRLTISESEDLPDISYWLGGVEPPMDEDFDPEIGDTSHTTYYQFTESELAQLIPVIRISKEQFDNLPTGIQNYLKDESNFYLYERSETDDNDVTITKYYAIARCVKSYVPQDYVIRETLSNEIIKQHTTYEFVSAMYEPDEIPGEEEEELMVCIRPNYGHSKPILSGCYYEVINKTMNTSIFLPGYKDALIPNSFIKKGTFDIVFHYKFSENGTENIYTKRRAFSIKI